MKNKKKNLYKYKYLIIKWDLKNKIFFQKLHPIPYIKINIVKNIYLKYKEFFKFRFVCHYYEIIFRTIRLQ
jgi:hypothetical protein